MSSWAVQPLARASRTEPWANARRLWRELPNRRWRSIYYREERQDGVPDFDRCFWTHHSYRVDFESE